MTARRLAMIDPVRLDWRCKVGQCNHQQAPVLLLASDPTKVFHPVVPVLSDLVTIDLAGLYCDGCVLCSRLNGPTEIEIAVLSYGSIVDVFVLNVDREARFLDLVLVGLAVGQIGRSQHGDAYE